MTDPSLDLRMRSRHANWWPFTAMALGIALVIAAVLPAAMGSPANPYASVLLVALAMLVVGCGVALAVFDMAHHRLSPVASAAIAGVAVVPVVAPIFMPIGTDLGIPMMYVFGIGLVFLAVRRSMASALFLLLTAFGPGAYVVLELSQDVISGVWI